MARTEWSKGLLAVALAAALAAQGWTVPSALAQQSRISQPLQHELEGAATPVSFLVILSDQLALPAGSGDSLARRQALYRALTAHARRSQAGLHAWLEQQGVPYRAHYLVNMVEVEGDLALANALAARPEVARLARNPAVRGAARQPRWLQRSELAPQSGTATLPWGLTATRADAAWELGARGQGIVVAGQDTGVAWEHPALQLGYRGWNTATLTATHAYNWLDAWGRDPLRDAECPSDPQIPCDDNGHGTHTLATVAGDATSMGDTVLGMAPAASWIACRNMRDGVGTPASYTTCFEFFLAPYPQGGDPLVEGRPELAPHVINNSWGCPPSEGCDLDSLRQVVETMRAAGIFVVASAGNAGPGCSSIDTPIGMHDAVTSVGAYDSDGRIAGFSSRGPVTADGSGRLKPDLSAPGVGVRSAAMQNSQPSVDVYLSGTSMAAPHVAGAVALLWSLAPQLIGQVEATELLLLSSAEPVVEAGCTGVAQSPNPVYGHGRLDALRLVQSAGAMERVWLPLVVIP